MNIQNKNFLEVSILELPRSLEPALTSWLFRQGCWGTAESLDFSQSNLRYPPKVKKKSFINISAFFPSGERETLDIDLSRWLREHSPASQTHWLLQKNQDWLTQWKKHFKVFKLGDLYFVPTWLKSKRHQLKSSVLLEPGMAFGTGTHATTQFAIELLQKLSQTDKDFSKKKVLDVGAGSGILSVVAARYGARQALAIDNDPESWRECRKMFKLNQTKKCTVKETQLHQIKLKYDIVLANIIDGVLISLKKDLWRSTKKGGFLILSGILTDGSTAFIRSFMDSKEGQVLAQLNDKEWTAFLIRKNK